MNVQLIESGRDRVARGQARLVLGDTDDLKAVCHDLRGHLASIGMIASALCAESSSSGLPAVRAAMAGALMEEVAATTEMVRRVATGRRDVGPVDVAELTQSCVQRAALVGTCRIRCTTAEVTVSADGLQLSRLLDNLIQNAVRAAGHGGLVEVTLQERRAAGRAAAVLTVVDSGPGFGRLPSRPASLGLRIVRTILREVGGSLTIDRSALGRGMVTVVLPLSRS